MLFEVIENQTGNHKDNLDLIKMVPSVGLEPTRK